MEESNPEVGGVWLSPYLFELRDVASSGIDAFERFRVAADAWLTLDQLGEHLTTEQSIVVVRSQRDMFSSVEQLLAAFARASLLVFPDRQGSSQRGDRLRAALGIDEHHMAGNRDLRNDWIHFDHRLDKALAEGAYTAAQHFMADAARLMRPDVLPRVMRVIDPRNEVVLFRGKQYLFVELRDALRDLYTRAEQVLWDSP